MVKIILKDGTVYKTTSSDVIVGEHFIEVCGKIIFNEEIAECVTV